MDKQSVKVKYKDAEDVRNYFTRSKLTVPSDDVLCLMCLPADPKYRECYIWLKEFFGVECQYPPNRGNMCELPAALYSKDSIYKLFEKECKFKHSSHDHSYCTLKEYRVVFNFLYYNIFYNHKFYHYHYI